MSPERAKMLEYARSIVKQAKWRHRGRKPWAVDCIGILVLSVEAAGGTIQDTQHYGREPWNDKLREHLQMRFGDPIPLDQAQPGDIALFKWPDKEPSHIGILGDYPHGGFSLIHANMDLGVVEHALAGAWLRLLHEVYRSWPT